jgi:oxygen-independent coproporphyrinogen-3 oxidase
MALGLYLHYPFCRYHCAYCDFYKETYQSDLEERYFAALQRETVLAADELRDHDRQLTSIYIGGGTPSLAAPELLQGWLEQVRTLFPFETGTELSLEINPDSCSRQLLEQLRKLGVTRPVFGVQTFDPKLLKLLTRQHRLHQVHESIYYANTLGFETFGCDLLYGMPGQTGRRLSSDLDQMVDLEPPHVSFYQLSVEEGTELERLVDSGRIGMPDSDFVHALYKAGYEHLSEAGYERYEVCSFARPGHECRHNLNYWIGGDYLGLGPSAHSFLNDRRYSVAPSLAEYLEALERDRRPLIEDRSGIDERMAEAIMLGLRTARGIDLARFEERFGRPLSEALDPDQFEMLLQAGHLLHEDDRLFLDVDSMLLADEIARRLLK